MENQNIDISKLDIVQLKSLGYDLLIQFQVIQNNLNVVNSEIAKRMNEQSNKSLSPQPIEGSIIPRV